MSKTTLHPITLAEAKSMFTWANDPEVVRTFGWSEYTYTLADEQAYLQRMIDSEQDVLYAIYSEHGVYLGNAGLHCINYTHETARISIIIGNKAYWGRGYGKKAVQVLLDKAFSVHNLYKIWGVIFTDDAKLKHLYESLGFTVEAVLKEEYCLHDERKDMFRISLLKKDWEVRLCKSH